MSSAISPSSLWRAETESEQSDGECQGCGAPLQVLSHKCEYCDRTTKHGARQARLAKLSAGANMGLGLGNQYSRLQENPFNNAYRDQWSPP